MEILQKIFPFSFGAKDTAGLVIKVLVYVVIGFAASVIIGILSIIPLIGLIIGIFGGFVNLYIVAAIVIAFLDFFKLLK